MKRTRWSMVLAIGAMLALAGCGDGKKGNGSTTKPDKPAGKGSGAGPAVAVKQATEKEAFEAFCLATIKHDTGALAQVVHPDYKTAYPALFTDAVGLGKVEAELATEVEAKYGKPVADEVRKRITNVAEEASAVVANGKVDWSKVTIAPEGDKAAATIAGRSAPVDLVKLNGKWYVMPPAFPAGTPQQIEEAAKQMKKLFDDHLTKTRDLLGKVKGGALTKEQFETAWKALQEFSGGGED